MKYDDETTLDYLLDCGIRICWDIGDAYVVDVKTNAYETLVWLVDKKTRIAKPTYSMDVQDECLNAKKITDYEVLKKTV